jgi:antitoxin component YwqK of YwqJK toxin-antitoxin module
MHGEMKIYSKSGQLQFEGSFVDGKREGIHKSYNENGEIIEELTFKNNVPEH